MKLRDRVILLSLALTVLLVVLLVANQPATDEALSRLQAGGLIGLTVLVAVWGLTRLSQR